MPFDVFLFIFTEEAAGMDISIHNGPAYEMSEGAAKPQDIEALDRSRHSAPRVN